ncbi:uncharacterized protein BYT42DRAFT_609601 [Radiomyces spectabilis]|uniref:uncharacterized protein n=1 Tax=Radiomyces spectabilis TaxID=64574 RepID=UPI00221EA69C|nr:uncharacterized protein BYT42DRAFT_609601 [Radiomyces spectabilis]KAI8393836.1 hypothetical protein BYT42DRAFT_609601 [Radiomyces spectabilis]
MNSSEHIYQILQTDDSIKLPESQSGRASFPSATTGQPELLSATTNNDQLVEYLFTDESFLPTSRNNASNMPVNEQHMSWQTMSLGSFQDLAVDGVNTAGMPSNDANHRHSDEDEYTEMQLKMMTSKERRQLRNKISARNFRNRRKEYITTLENQIEKYRSENSQLKLEVKWSQTTMERLQKENDQLRLQLALCNKGIKEEQSQEPGYPLSSKPMIQPGYTIAVPPPANHLPTYDPLTMSQHHFAPEFTVPSDSSSSSDSSHSPPRQPSQSNDSWDLVFSEFSPTHCTYLSHAAMPNWDFTPLLSKVEEALPSTNPSDIFHQYPLLAPALMSIIVTHSMTMTTEELLRNAQLQAPITQPSSRSFAEDMFLSPKFNAKLRSPTLPALTNTDIEAMWGSLLKHMPTNSKPHRVVTSYTDPPVTGMQTYCPLFVIQKTLCRFVINVVVARYPHLEHNCIKYLPVCEKFKRRLIMPA